MAHFHAKHIISAPRPVQIGLRTLWVWVYADLPKPSPTTQMGPGRVGCGLGRLGKPTPLCFHRRRKRLALTSSWTAMGEPSEQPRRLARLLPSALTRRWPSHRGGPSSREARCRMWPARPFVRMGWSHPPFLIGSSHERFIICMMPFCLIQWNAPVPRP
jgi:hypothetical protein